MDIVQVGGEGRRLPCAREVRGSNYVEMPLVDTTVIAQTPRFCFIVLPILCFYLPFPPALSLLSLFVLV